MPTFNAFSPQTHLALLVEGVQPRLIKKRSAKEPISNMQNVSLSSSILESSENLVGLQSSSSFSSSSTHSSIELEVDKEAGRSSCISLNFDMYRNSTIAQQQKTT